MGKFLKNCIIISLLCIIAGIALSGAGIFNGGLPRLKEEVLGGEWSISKDDVKPFFELEEPDFFDKDHIVNIDVADMENTFSAENIYQLSIKGAGVAIEFTEHDSDDYIVSESNVHQFQVYVEGHELCIIARNKNIQTTEGVITISIPSSVLHAELLDVELEAAACAVNMNRLAVNELDINISAGAVECTALTVQDLKIDMAAGAVDFDIVGNFTDYNYEVDCAGGSVKIGEQALEGISQKFELDNEAQKNIEIDCSVGAMKISFID